MDRFPLLPARFLTTTALLGALLASSGCQDFRSMFFRRTLERDVNAMEDPIFPDERRSGIAGLQRRPEGKEAPYTDRFRQIARVDESAAVRAQAVRALNQARDPASLPLFITSLNDADPKVRLEAVKALRHVADDRAVPRLVELSTSTSENRDVRIWATTALRNYTRLEVARSLVPLLSGRDFAVATEARLALRHMTGGRDFHYDEGLWLRYFTTNPAPFSRAPKPPVLASTRPANP